ncbi:MAG: tetratricopeptide repeat protein [Xanthomonadales bacterium]|nr:tetratricopeptide repeat protein [Xanthomonadales bacterium]
MQRLLVYLLLALLVPLPAVSAGLDETLEPLLEGEFALQQGDAKAAAAAYARAAEHSDDVDVADRAVRAALAAKDTALARRGLARWAQLAPNAPDLAAARLRLALLESHRGEASAALDALFAQPEGWRRAAAALASAPDAAFASGLIGYLLDGNRMPADFDAWLAMGGVALRLEDRTLYSRLAQAVVGKFPTQVQALIWQAEDAQTRKDMALAKRSLEAAAALPDMSVADRLALAAQFNAMSEPAKAAAVLEAAGEDDRAVAARAVYLSAAKDMAGLERLYTALVERTPAEATSPPRLMLLGQIAEMLDKLPEALAFYRRIPGGIQREQGRLRIAVLLARSGDEAASLDVLREIQASDSEWADIVRDAYLVEAELARDRKDTVAEISALGRGLSIFEDDATLRYNRALAYERNDQIDAAVADLRVLLAAEPEEPDWLNALGYTLVDRTEQREEGLALIEKALALKPDSAAIQDSMGWALHRLGRDADALPYLKRAFEQQRDAEVAAHLARVLAALNQLDEARSILRLARELDPDSPALRRVLEELPAQVREP